MVVDDDPDVLVAIARNFRSRFAITTANGGAAALECMARAEQPFAVIVSDMRMPNMDGASFLARAHDVSLESTRVLLTGETNLASAVKAVNEGRIFRFLCKPCSPETLALALEAGVEQHRLITTERDIMERTLAAVVKTLGDVLFLAEPALFERTMLVKGYVGQIVQRLQLEGAWQIEVAAALHTLGLIALPTELARRGQTQAPVTLEEKRMLEEHPETTRRILNAIPRLEEVALIVAQQTGDVTEGSEWVQRGARVLRLAMRLEQRVSRGASLEQAIDAMSAMSADAEERAQLDALRARASDAGGMQRRALLVRELQPRMTLEEDVKTGDGTLVLAKGHELSAILIERLMQLASSRGIEEPIQVSVPVAAATAKAASN